MPHVPTIVERRGRTRRALPPLHHGQHLLVRMTCNGGTTLRELVVEFDRYSPCAPWLMVRRMSWNASMRHFCSSTEVDLLDPDRVIRVATEQDFLNGRPGRRITAVS